MSAAEPHKREQHAALLWALAVGIWFVAIVLSAPAEKVTPLNVIPGTVFQASVLVLCVYASRRLSLPKWRRVSVVVLSIYLFMGFMVNLFVLAAGKGSGNYPLAGTCWLLQFVLGLRYLKMLVANPTEP